MTANKRSFAIDCLRGVAILWVLLYHFVPLPIFDHGLYGVLLFFIISGYCILISAESSQSGWHFYAKRLGRLLPAMLVCSFITTALKYAAPQWSDPDRFSNWWDFFYTPIGVSTLNILQRPFRLPDGTYWSLFIEFRFYIACFGIMLLGQRHQILRFLGLIAGFQTLTTGSAGANDFFPFFIAGVSVAVLTRGDTLEGLLGIGFAFGLDAYNLICHATNASIPVTEARSVFLWLGTGLVYLASIYRPSKIANVLLWPLWFLGLVSYPLYLIHFNVGETFIRWAQISADPPGLWERAIGVTCLMSILAYLIYFIVERHAIRPLTDALAKFPTMMTRFNSQKREPKHVI